MFGGEARIPGTLKDSLRRAPYWGILRYVQQGLEMGVYFRRGLTFWEHGWAFLS